MLMSEAKPGSGHVQETTDAYDGGLAGRPDKAAARLRARERSCLSGLLKRGERETSEPDGYEEISLPSC